MTRVHHTALSVLLLMSASASSHADELELKKGAILNGVYAGGTAATVRFSTPAGMRVVPTSEIVALTFTGGSASSPAASASTPSAAAVATSGAATIPTGTPLLVRTLDPVTSRDEPGSVFTATLATDLMVNAIKVAPAGAQVFGKVQRSTQAGRLAGRSTLEIRLYQLSIPGQNIPIVTDIHHESGASSSAKLMRSAGAGAAIGELASNDAGRGAAMGTSIAALRRGQLVAIPAGTLIEFTLTQPVTVQKAP